MRQWTLIYLNTLCWYKATKTSSIFLTNVEIFFTCHFFLIKPYSRYKFSTSSFCPLLHTILVKEQTQRKTSTHYPANIYSFKVNNRNTRQRCEICSKLTTKTSERHHWRRSGVFIVNSDHISHLFLLFLMLTLSK